MGGLGDPEGDGVGSMERGLGGPGGDVVAVLTLVSQILLVLG